MKIPSYILKWLYSLEPAFLGFVFSCLAFINPVFLFFLPVFVFCILPIMDFYSKDDTFNSERLHKRVREYRWFFELVARLYLPIQLLVFGLCFFLVYMNQADLIVLFGAALTCGIVNGIGIAPAHELNHSSKRKNKAIASLMLSLSAYGHFLIEHNKGHHVKVATPEDPASARFNESFWKFLVRSSVMGFLSATKLLTKHKDYKKYVFLSWIITLSILIFSMSLSAKLFLFFVMQAAVSVILLEAVNYIEHYGLKRRKIGEAYEECNHQHSWNSNKIVSNLGLFNLQRHSDHHANAMRPYEMLRHFEDSPQHPTGYAAMIVLALVPPLWFRVMDPRVVALYGGDVSKANLHPGKAEQLKRRFQSR